MTLSSIFKTGVFLWVTTEGFVTLWLKNLRAQIYSLLASSQFPFPSHTLIHQSNYTHATAISVAQAKHRNSLAHATFALLICLPVERESGRKPGEANVGNAYATYVHTCLLSQ